jgi:hypothetical protein
VKNKLSLFDRKFLTACHIRWTSARFEGDSKFLAGCGISSAPTPEEFLAANRHYDIAPCRKCGVNSFEQHAAGCPHGAPLPNHITAHDEDIRKCAERIAKHQAPMQLDGTCRLLLAIGLPLTRENYLRLAFAGKPPEEPLDGEIEAELPKELQMDDINDAPSSGECGESTYTTHAGFPICPTCGRSTRNMNALVCGPCRNHTRLVLTKADRRWLRELRIAR